MFSLTSSLSVCLSFLSVSSNTTIPLFPPNLVFLTPLNPLSIANMCMCIWPSTGPWAGRKGTLSPSNNQLPIASQLGMWFLWPPPPSILGFWPAFSGLMHPVTAIWVHMYNCPVQSRKCYFTIVIHPLWLLQSFWRNLPAGSRKLGRRRCKVFSGARASWQLGAREYHKVIPWNKLHTTDLLGRNRMVAASDWEQRDQWAEQRRERASIGSLAYLWWASGKV